MTASSVDCGADWRRKNELARVALGAMSPPVYKSQLSRIFERRSHRVYERASLIGSPSQKVAEVVLQPSVFLTNFLMHYFLEFR